MKCTYRVYVSLARFFYGFESLRNFIRVYLWDFALSNGHAFLCNLFQNTSRSLCLNICLYGYFSVSSFFSSIAMSQSPILPQLRLGWSSPKRSLCSSPRSAAPSSRNPGIQNIRRKRMDGLASKHTGCNINDKVNVDNDRSSSRDCLEELVQHQHQLLVGHWTLDKCWCWLMLIDSD